MHLFFPNHTDLPPPTPPPAFASDLRHLAETCVDLNYRALQRLVHERILRAVDRWSVWESFALRWLPDFPDPPIGDWFLLQRALSEAPLPIKSFFFRSLARGWTTQARMRQSWAPCVFGCCGPMGQDHVKHYFDDCTLWNYISNMVPGFVADMGPKLFGLHFTELVQVQLQVLGVAFATQIYIFKSKNPNVVLERLVRALWLSRPFYRQFFA